MKKNILYISLTGMTEPLGRSQVLEYLIDLSQNNNIYLISFERKNDLKSIDEVKQYIKNKDIHWTYLDYSNKYGLFSTVLQIIKAIYIGNQFIIKESVTIIHARSIIPATIGLFLKKIHNLSLIFDIRGFAIDEKIDTGRLKRDSFLVKCLKKWENYLYKQSDYIVTLTHKAKEILNKNYNISFNKIAVIPTCANNELFFALEDNDRQKLKLELGFANNDVVIIHTGTVSGWYDFEKELMLMKNLMDCDERVKFLILNKNEQTYIFDMLKKNKINQDKTIVKSVEFNEVYRYLNIAQYSLFFIKPSFSKQASAPTKFAENVACLLPSITNKNVGDMEYYISEYQVGLLFDLNNFDIEKNSKEIINNLNVSYDTVQFKDLFDKHFSKLNAIKEYERIYKEVG